MLMFTVQERTSAVKHLHFVSGVSPRTYWAAALGWDLTLYRSGSQRTKKRFS